MSGVTCTREATQGDVYTDAGARDPSVRITRIEARGGCSSRLLDITSSTRDWWEQGELARARV